MQENSIELRQHFWVSPVYYVNSRIWRDYSSSIFRSRINETPVVEHCSLVIFTWLINHSVWENCTQDLRSHLLEVDSITSQFSIKKAVRYHHNASWIKKNISKNIIYVIILSVYMSSSDQPYYTSSSCYHCSQVLEANLHIYRYNN